MLAASVTEVGGGNVHGLQQCVASASVLGVRRCAPLAAQLVGAADVRVLERSSGGHGATRRAGETRVAAQHASRSRTCQHVLWDANSANQAAPSGQHANAEVHGCDGSH